MSYEKRENSFTWFIENYSYGSFNIGEKLISPPFSADGLDGTLWSLQLYPRGQKYEYKENISLYLNRSKVDDGPEEFPILYKISFLAVDGSSLCSWVVKHIFKMGKGYGHHTIITRDEVLLRRKSDYIPQDTLTVNCKLWREKGTIQPVIQMCARTRIGIEEISFIHITESFSTLEPNEKKTAQIRSPVNKGIDLLSSLHFTSESSCEEKVFIEITPTGTTQILTQLKLFVVDVDGNETECGEDDNRYDATRKEIQKLPLSFTRKIILDRKNEFLPNDKLSVLCKCIFSAGVEYEKIESTQHERPIVASNQMNKNDQNKGVYYATHKLSTCPSALDDFKAIFNNEFLTDVELKTKTKSFPAHKIILCARSSVFKSMMTNDMKEKNTNCIQIDDLEDDTVQQLLIFLYSDNLENLHWDSAMKLYYAADKYEVVKLKVLCSTFLLRQIKISNASELLLLADTHNDSDLKKEVEDFIFKHEEQVFGSEEWRNLIETNSLLVSKTMCLKYIKKIVESGSLKY